MSKLKAIRAKNRLHGDLALADDEAFCRLIWATRELQTRAGDAHRKVFLAPPEAHTTELNKGQYIFPWLLETLVNELMTTPKRRPRAGQQPVLLNCGRWATIARMANRLRRWEDLEDGLELTPENILRAVDRITHQQFHWQHGDLNLSSFYRSARLYGGDHAAAHLRDRGLSLNALSATGMAVWGALERSPYVDFTLDLSPLGISRQQQENAMAAICAPLSSMRSQARSLRAGRRHPAYAPSVLRAKPGIRGMLDGSKVLVPLPELVLARTTAGVYYDVIGGGAEVRNEIGARFETYASDLLSSTIQSLTFSGEYRYRRRKNHIDSPDLLARHGGSLVCVVECKATKMSFDSKFTLNPLDDGNRGFDEIAKGVFQIWRYFAHSREGDTADTAIDDNAIGVVLTLDSWVQVSFTTKEKILSRARQMVLERAPEIAESDMKPIAIYSVENLENLVLNQPDEIILDQLRRACRDKPIPDEAEPDLTLTAIEKPYPFKDKLGLVLPWWDILSQGREP
ncbi:hypothetical protein [Caulobacter sp. RHG1]|uniref:hypothetical protein n=1 Tax=Caulobacter sp. (strain RHG1) TaxID=2545762 RepID=UPI001557F336|nr:hypothetical protein [Caulobacter sp. RHG1]